MVINEKSIRRKSNVNAEGEEEDFLQDLADDAIWKRIQLNTFTRWANEHLKTVNKYVACLESDMSDGIRLLSLVEVLSGKKLPRYNARPTMKAQKLNNVDTALKFLCDVEKIKLVNISSADIVDGNLKLILGLMWTLILHYSISMPVWEGEDDFDPSLSPKQRLLKWIQNKIPDCPVNNFSTDWNDGRAIGALIDSLAPGLCPDWKSWKPEDNLKNVTEALQLAEDWLDIPQLIRPKEMCNRKVDELAMMTYLSQFPGAKLKENAPLRSSAFNPARVRCYGPGLQASGVCVGVDTQFTVETFSAGGKGDVEVSIADPQQATVPVDIKYNDDKNMTYTCTYTPTIEGDHKVQVNYNKSEVPKSPWNVSVKGVPQGEGHKKCSASGPGLEAAGKVKAGQQTYIDIGTKGAGPGQVDVVILDPEGKPNNCPCRLSKVSEDKYKCEYVAAEPGEHSISVLFAGKPIPKSPFTVQVDPFVDPRKVKTVGRGLQPTGLRVGDKASFQVAIDGGDVIKDLASCLHAKLIGPDGKEEKVEVKERPERDSDGRVVLDCEYTPRGAGDHRLSISMGGDNIRQFEVNVAPPSQSKVVAFGPGLHGGVVGKSNKFRVDTNGERGTLGFTIDGPSEAKIECKDNGDGTADVEWTVSTAGEYALHVMSNGEDIPNSPYCASIKPANKFDKKEFDDWYKKTHTLDCKQWKESNNKKKKSAKETTTSVSAGGVPPEDKVRKMLAGLPSTLTIKMADPTGLTAYILAPSGAKTDCDLKPHEDGSGKLSVTFTANEPGEHLVYLIKNEKQVGGSPFKIQVSSKVAGDPKKVKVEGESLQGGKLDEENVFFIDIRAAGTGGRIGVSMQGPSKPEVTCDPTDEAGLFKVTWVVDEPGKYNLELKYDGTELEGSPFTIDVPKN